LGAFGIGAQFNALLAPAFSGASWIVNGGVNRYGLPNYSVWAATFQGGVQVPVSSCFAIRGTAGVVFDRLRGEFSSGTESGFTLNTGVVYVPRPDLRFSFVGEVGVSSRRDTQDIGLGLGLLMPF
jgi:hypothetical protein